MNRTIQLLCLVLILILLLFFVPSYWTNPEVIGSEAINMSLFFCPREDCESEFVSVLSSANSSLHCALYEINLPSVISAFDKLSADGIDLKIITEKDFYEIKRPFIIPDNNSQAMHNKFCIIDGKIVTAGSMNPTDNDAHKNNNNLLIFNSPTIASIFESEFSEFETDVFGAGNSSFKRIVSPNSSLSFFFCPDDDCSLRVQSLLSSANKSIKFATFSFTDDALASELISARNRGVEVEGVFEKRLSTRESVMQKLAYQGIPVYTDGNKNTMHHKFFIIDNRIVVTGSYNPTQNGNLNNDEHVVIIEDEDFAKKYSEEYALVLKEAVKFVLS